jgi:hypothetical protein
MREVAERSGTSLATIYRRWPSRTELLLDAIQRFVEQDAPVPDTGELRALRMVLQRARSNGQLPAGVDLRLVADTAMALFARQAMLYGRPPTRAYLTGIVDHALLPMLGLGLPQPPPSGPGRATALEQVRSPVQWWSMRAVPVRTLVGGDLPARDGLGDGMLPVVEELRVVRRELVQIGVGLGRQRGEVVADGCGRRLVGRGLAGHRDQPGPALRRDGDVGDLLAGLAPDDRPGRVATIVLGLEHRARLGVIDDRAREPWVPAGRPGALTCRGEQVEGELRRERYPDGAGQAGALARWHCRSPRRGWSGGGCRQRSGPARRPA